MFSLKLDFPPKSPPLARTPEARFNSATYNTQTQTMNKAVFTASTQDNWKIIVKFAKAYNKKARSLNVYPSAPEVD